jgi:hypothetical protein
MAKEAEHKDLLGNPITTDSKLAVSHHNDLIICSVVKINPKMLRVRPINSRYRAGDGYLVYPSQTVVVDGPDVMAYILRGN